MQNFQKLKRGLERSVAQLPGVGNAEAITYYCYGRLLTLAAWAASDSAWQRRDATDEIRALMLKGEE